MMALFWSQPANDWAGARAVDLIPMRRNGPKGDDIGSSFKVGASWAARKIRAELISALPVNVYRNRPDGTTISVATPPVLQTPDGEADISQFIWSWVMDWDTFGNHVGLKTAYDGNGMVRQIQQVPMDQVTVTVKAGAITYTVGGKVYQPSDVWHQKCFVLSGMPVGLSQMAMAAYNTQSVLSAQEFALKWFGSGGGPAAILKSSTREHIPANEAALIQERVSATVANRGILVTGTEWSWDQQAVNNNEADFIQTQQMAVDEFARIYGVDADLIGGGMSTGSKITYANIAQRNLQSLIIHFQPTITRIEKALSALLPAPYYVKLDTDSLLRMDTASRFNAYAVAINSRILTPDEARMLEDREPLSPADYQQFDELFGGVQAPIDNSTTIVQSSS